MSNFGVRNIAGAAGAPGSHTATSSSSEIVPADLTRKGIWITNISNKTVYVAFGQAAELSKGVRVVKNERIQFGAAMCVTESITVITASGSHDVIYQEWF